MGFSLTPSCEDKEELRLEILAGRTNYLPFDTIGRDIPLLSSDKNEIDYCTDLTERNALKLFSRLLLQRRTSLPHGLSQDEFVIYMHLILRLKALRLGHRNKFFKTLPSLARQINYGD